MDVFVVDKNSFHYRFNLWMMGSKKYTYKNSAAREKIEERKDFCSYWRLFMRNIIVALVMTIFFAVVAAIAITLLGIFVFAAYENPMSFLYTILSVLGIFTVILFIVALPEISQHFKEKRRQRDYEKTLDPDYQPRKISIVEAKYRAWKNKICPAVEFK